MKKLDRRV